MSEDFLSRWSRLKRESALPAPRSEAGSADSEPPLRDSASAPAFDVPSLPAIESISAESTVAAFLRSGVPDDLTRAALRKAWTSDPAIRDFVGIAENQWDFNGEGTIAGFGSLSAEEYARHIAALALRAEDSRAAPVTNADQSEASGAAGPHDSNNGPPVMAASTLPPQTHPGAAPVPECTAAPQTRKTHGTALPR